MKYRLSYIGSSSVFKNGRTVETGPDGEDIIGEFTDKISSSAGVRFMPHSHNNTIQLKMWSQSSPYGIKQKDLNDLARDRGVYDKDHELVKKVELNNPMDPFWISPESNFQFSFKKASTRQGIELNEEDLYERYVLAMLKTKDDVYFFGDESYGNKDEKPRSMKSMNWRVDFVKEIASGESSRLSEESSKVMDYATDFATMSKSKILMYLVNARIEPGDKSEKDLRNDAITSLVVSPNKVGFFREKNIDMFTLIKEFDKVDVDNCQLFNLLLQTDYLLFKDNCYKLKDEEIGANLGECIFQLKANLEYQEAFEQLLKK